MVEVRIIDNATRPAGEELLESLEWASDVRIATAFVKGSGVSRLHDSFERVLARGGEIQVVYGLDFRITDPEAIEEFISLADGNPDSVKHYAYSDWGLALSHVFHPKLYVCAGSEGSARVLMGSSNLTRGGLWSNFEVNAVIAGTLNDPAVIQAGARFDAAVTRDGCFTPTPEYVDAYRELRRKAMAVPFFPEPPDELAAAYQAIKRLESRQEPAAGGWEEAILSCVRTMEAETNSSSFNLPAFYERFGAELAALYPRNHTIEAKIRQQLQSLRNKNILAVEGVGRYRVIA